MPLQSPAKFEQKTELVVLLMDRCLDEERCGDLSPKYLSTKR